MNNLRLPRATRSGLSRRVVLSLPALAVAGGLAACNKRESPIVPTTPTASPASAAAEALTTGETLNLSVGPLVRVTHQGSDLSVLPLTIARPKDAVEPTLNAAAVIMGGITSNVVLYRPLRLIDSAGLRVWSTTTGKTDFGSIAPGDDQDLYPTFGPVDVDTVTVFLSHGGFIEVPVVNADDAQAPKLDVGSIVSNAKLQDTLRDPVSIERYSVALDGSSSGLTDGDETSVDVASDVTFAVDSAELTAQADDALKGVAETIGGYSGGELTITGHTDDVADDAHNQKLSEDRAQAVADRLGKLTDLSAWTTTVAGKGETEPKSANDTEEDTVMVDHPDGGALPWPWRLTDVPVVEG